MGGVNGMIPHVLTNPEPDFEQEPRSPWGQRLLGLALILAAVALTACLASYNVHEMGWAFLNPHDAEAAAARPCTNVLGVPGLYLAGLLCAAFGIVAYYLLFLLAIEGMVSLFGAGGNRVRPVIALLVMLACALAAADVQPWPLPEWVAAPCTRGAGGALGYLYGSCVLEALMAGVVKDALFCSIWTLVLLIVVHGVALIYFGRTSLRGVWQELRYLTGAFCRGVGGWFARRREARRARADKRAAEWLARQAAEREYDEEDYPEDALQPQGDGEPRSLFEPEAGYEPPRSFEEREERQREDDLRRVSMQDAPSARTRLAPPLRRRDNNLLDLMQEVQTQVELDSYEDDWEPAPPAPAPAPAPRPAPRSQPAPAPRRQAVAASRPLPPAPSPQPVKDSRKQEADYPLPPYDLLSYEPVSAEHSEEVRMEMADMQQRIIKSLSKFRIPVTEGDITRGPSITRYEFYPPDGLRVNRITNLSNELMLATCSKSINILAPVPGKDTVGIELANTHKTPVYLRELLQDAAFRSPKLRIPVALGKDVYGHTVIGDLAAMPHTLVAGTTGSGKSVCINSMIISMLYKFRPDELKLILVDPKVVEMQPYKRLPHLACPVVTNPGRVISALRWAVNEMEHRYKLFSKIGVRNFEDYNRHACEYIPEEEPLEAEDAPDASWIEDFASDIERQAEDEVALSKEEEQGEFDFDDDNDIPLHLPYIVIIIDELADLMMMVKDDLETQVARLTQKARAAGIHLVVATQTPRSNVVTGMIKANIPSRLAFKVASQLDSRIILESAGAENLLGQGDFLFLPPGGITRMTRAQGAFVSDAEVAMVVKHCARYARQNFEQGVMTEMENAEGAPNADNGGRITGSKSGNDEEDELYTRCVNLVVADRKASTSLLQRRFSIGYGRAAKMMDLMEARGVISPPQGATHTREVLVDAL